MQSFMLDEIFSEENPRNERATHFFIMKIFLEWKHRDADEKLEISR
jgi:hypothetical protein